MEVSFFCNRSTPLTDKVRGTIVMEYLSGRAIFKLFDTIIEDDDREITRSRVTGFNGDDRHCRYVEHKKPHWESVVTELQSIINDGGEVYIEFFD